MDNYLSLKDHVYRYLSDQINEGLLRPGDKISEAQVGEKLKISRTPVREALIHLCHDGFLENLPRKGFRVKELDVKKAQNLYEIIGMLDGRAATLCIDLITEKQLEEMFFLAKSMDLAIENGLRAKYYELQIEFHNIYLSLCPNTEMVIMLERLKSNFFRKYYKFPKDKNELDILRETNNQHYKIIELFKSKDKYQLETFIRDNHWRKEQAEFDCFSYN